MTEDDFMDIEIELWLDELNDDQKHILSYMDEVLSDMDIHSRLPLEEAWNCLKPFVLDALDCGD